MGGWKEEKQTISGCGGFIRTSALESNENGNHTYKKKK